MKLKRVSKWDKTNISKRGRGLRAIRSNGEVRGVKPVEYDKGSGEGGGEVLGGRAVLSYKGKK